MSEKNNHPESEQKERYTFTLPPSLIEKIEEVAFSKQMNRSQIVREALTAWLDQEVEYSSLKLEDGVVLITYLYNHHDNRVVSDLLHSQHEFEEVILSSTHIHVSHIQCFEIIIAKGKIFLIRQLGDKIRSVKGVSNFKVNFSTL